jgi:hypothetical protein
MSLDIINIIKNAMQLLKEKVMNVFSKEDQAKANPSIEIKTEAPTKYKSPDNVTNIKAGGKVDLAKFIGETPDETYQNIIQEGQKLLHIIKGPSEKISNSSKSGNQKSK